MRKHLERPPEPQVFRPGSRQYADILWGRRDFTDSPGTEHLFSVFGHTPGVEIRQGSNYMCIDTEACFLGGALTGVVFPEMKVYTAKNPDGHQ